MVVSRRDRPPPRPPAAAGRAAGTAAAFFLLPAGAKSVAVTTTTEAAAATTTGAPVWVNDHESGSAPRWSSPPACRWRAAILFTYDLYSIAPLEAFVALESRRAPYRDRPGLVHPHLPGRDDDGRPLGPRQRAGRFEVPAGITTAQVEAITVDSYWVPVPGGYTIELSPSSGAWAPAAPGIRARIVQVVEQAENRLVIVELEGEATLANDLAIAGDGPDWQSSSYSRSGAGAGPWTSAGRCFPTPSQSRCEGWAGSRCPEAVRSTWRGCLDERRRPARGPSLPTG